MTKTYRELADVTVHSPQVGSPGTELEFAL